MQSTTEKPALIINLSTLHGLHSISETAAKFVELANRYSSCCSVYCPQFVGTAYNYAWVMTKHWRFDESHIHDEKVGKITWRDFSKILNQHFPFVLSNIRTMTEEELDALWQHHDELLSLSGKEKISLSKQDRANALLELYL